MNVFSIPSRIFFFIADLILASLLMLGQIKMKKRAKELRKVWDSREKDVVTLHTLDRGVNCPSTSPFPIKLELYLKMAGIKYIPDYEIRKSSKGKSPWITVNGKDIEDSQLAIEYLSYKMRKDIEASFSEAERAISKSFRILIEDHFYWCRVLESWVYLEGTDNLAVWAPGSNGIPKWMPESVRHYLLKTRGLKGALEQATGAGMGRHSREDVERLGKSALDAYSSYLGDKSFLLGDQPCLADVSIFGFLCLFMAKPKNSGSVYRAHIEKNCQNLTRMWRRMIKQHWPDYDQYVYGCNLP